MLLAIWSVFIVLVAGLAMAMTLGWRRWTAQPVRVAAGGETGAQEGVAAARETTRLVETQGCYPRVSRDGLRAAAAREAGR